MHDIIIIGGGPAGLTAGIYAARGGMDAVLLESLSVMGQATMTDMIENYPGVKETSGFELLSTIKEQAGAFGLKMEQDTVTSLSVIEGHGGSAWQVEGGNGQKKALAVIVAAGAVPRKMNVPGEEDLLGKGVSYCATCDGAFFRDKDIIVVGGGDTAVEEALFLTRFGKSVTIVHRRDRLRAAKVIQDRAFSSEKIKFLWDSVIESINGKEAVESVTASNVKTGKKMEVSCQGVFIFAGWIPNTSFLDGAVELDKKGHIVVGHDMSSSAKGIFAAGDCVSKKLHQIVTACGDGATAAYSAQHYVEEIKGIAYK